MTRIVLLVGLLFVAVMAVRIGERLSPDAIGLGLGVLLGLLAGIPTALLVLAASRRREETDSDARQAGRRGALANGQPYGALPQPPVIVITGPGGPAQSGGQLGYGGVGYAGFPEASAMSTRRRFLYAGEREDEADDFIDA
ncbi:MAG: hypothetical protein KJZ93_04780 [Caldilineaceae bacterium]|nr:hypothetical protein [Caldilineaceae bacterium]